MKQKSKNQKPVSDYYYKSRLTNQFRELKKIVTAPEYRLFEKYETVIIIALVIVETIDQKIFRLSLNPYNSNQFIG